MMTASNSAAENLSLTWLRKIESVCSRFESLPADQRDIDAHLQGFTGLARERLVEELRAIDEQLRSRESSSISGSGDNRSIDLSLPQSDRFEFLQSIGSGGIGRVYRVYDREAFRPLAIKTLHANLLHQPMAHGRFRREAILTGTLQHPGIPPIYDRGTLDGGVPFFSMKLVEGKTLADMFGERSSTTESRLNLIQIFLGIAQTVAYAHDRKVVHRDLKPRNIMVGAFGEVQVMDWGLAKHFGSPEDMDLMEGVTDETNDPPANPDEVDTHDDSAKTNESEPRFADSSQHPELTSSGDVIGTLGYMAPEQARGDSDQVGPPADVFSLGVILFEIICGQPVFASRDRDALLRQTRQGVSPDAMRRLADADASPQLIDLCRRCLCPEPSGRPADAGLVAARVAEFLTGFERRLHQAKVDRAAEIVRGREIRKRHAWIVGLGSAVVAVAALAIVLISGQLVKTRRLAHSERDARRRADAEAQTAQEINSFLESAIASGLPENRGPGVKLIEVIDDLVPRLDGKLDNRPEVEARIRRTVGQSYRWLGDLDASEKQLRLAIAAFDRAGKERSLEKWLAEDRLAGTLRSRDDGDDLQRAVAIRRRLLTQFQTTLGKSHDETLRLMNNLGLTLAESGQLDEAETMLRSMLEYGEQQPVFDEPRRMSGILNLATIASERRDWSTAETLYNQVLQSDQIEPEVRANAYSQMGSLYDERSMHGEAAQYHLKCHEIRGQQYGELNRLTLSAWRKYTRSLTRAGRHEVAIEACRNSERMHTEADWFASGAVQEARLLQAENLAAIDQTAQAIEVLQETIDRFAEHRGKDHRYTLEAVERLGKLR